MGAGVSTERSGLFKPNFFELIKNELNISTEINFPTLMTEYTKKNGRNMLYKQIVNRFDYLKRFVSLKSRAQQFNEIISKIPMFTHFITTNWDDTIETINEAKSISNYEEYSLFKSYPGRMVFKIHGSISKLSSIVATKMDYTYSYFKLRFGFLGKALKCFIGKKGIIFVGYSMRDYDFEKFYLNIKKFRNGVHDYAVVFDQESLKNVEKLGIIPIQSDAINFAENLHKLLIDTNQILSDKYYLEVLNIENLILMIHFHLEKNYNPKQFPLHIRDIEYQHGIIHTISVSRYLAKTGKLFDIKIMDELLDQYRESLISRVQQGDFLKEAYITGCLEVLEILANKKESSDFNFYYPYSKFKIKNFEDYQNVITQFNDKKRLEFFETFFNTKLKGDPDIIWDSEPFL
jgi:hypothetical protein